MQESGLPGLGGLFSLEYTEMGGEGPASELDPRRGKRAASFQFLLLPLADTW